MTAPELSSTERATVERFERAPDALAADEVSTAVVGALVNVARLPEWMQAPALGRDIRPLGDLIADALLPLIEAREKAAGARALREAQREVQAVYDMQCPTMTPDRYVDRGAWMAHQWWQSVLGGTLRKLRDRADQIEARP